MSDLAEILTARIDPVLDRFVLEMVSLFEQRIEAELVRFGAAFESALSTFISEVEHVDSDRTDPDPVPRVRRRANRKLPLAQDREIPRAAQAPTQRRKEGQRAARLVADDPDPGTLRVRVEGHAAPAIMQARPCGCAPRGPHRKGCIQVPVTRRPPAFEPLAVPSPPVRRLQPKPEALADRLKVIAKRAPKPTAPKEENDNADERWGRARIDEETELAENRKHEGELPTPRSSFRVDSGEVEELDFGGADR